MKATLGPVEEKRQIARMMIHISLDLGAVGRACHRKLRASSSYRINDRENRANLNVNSVEAHQQSGPSSQLTTVSGTLPLLSSSCQLWRKASAVCLRNDAMMTTVTYMKIPFGIVCLGSIAIQLTRMQAPSEHTLQIAQSTITQGLAGLSTSISIRKAEGRWNG